MRGFASDGKGIRIGGLSPTVAPAVDLAAPTTHRGALAGILTAGDAAQLVARAATADELGDQAVVACADADDT